MRCDRCVIPHRAGACFNIYFMIYSGSEFGSDSRPRYEKEILGLLPERYDLYGRLSSRHLCATGFFVFSYSVTEAVTRTTGCIIRC